MPEPGWSLCPGGNGEGASQLGLTHVTTQSPTQVLPVEGEGSGGVWKLFPGTGHRRSAACVPLCCLAGDLYTQAAEAATEAMKGRLATQYYEKAEEAWAQMEE